jgi:hypothetical protein
MKYILALLCVAILGSCSLFKSKCTSVVLKTEHANFIQTAGENSMYSFFILKGELSGAIIHINSMATGDKDVFFVNPAKTYVTEAIEKEKWVIKEKKDETKQEVDMSGSIALKVDGVAYCFDLSYTGPMVKHPGPPPLIPHQE